jgi:hypothetical protein
MFMFAHHRSADPAKPRRPDQIALRILSANSKAASQGVAIVSFST